MSEEDKSEIKELFKEALAEVFPKEWLSKKDLATEFNVDSTTIWRLINDVEHPLPFTTMGKSKQLFHRPDVNAYLERRKRNAG